VRELSLLVEMHLGLGGLTATPLPFLRYITLIVSHANSSKPSAVPFRLNFWGTMIVAEKEKDARLACVFRCEFG
jgi:hypothetical protein